MDDEEIAEHYPPLNNHGGRVEAEVGTPAPSTASRPAPARAVARATANADAGTDQIRITLKKNGTQGGWEEFPRCASALRPMSGWWGIDSEGNRFITNNDL